MWWNLNSMWFCDAIWQHRSRSILAQVRACCLMAPYHYQNQCCLITNKGLWHAHFHKKCSGHLSLTWVYKLLIHNDIHISWDQWVNTWWGWMWLPQERCETQVYVSSWYILNIILFNYKLHKPICSLTWELPACLKKDALWEPYMTQGMIQTLINSERDLQIW